MKEVLHVQEVLTHTAKTGSRIRLRAGSITCRGRRTRSSPLSGGQTPRYRPRLTASKPIGWRRPTHHPLSVSPTPQKNQIPFGCNPLGSVPWVQSRGYPFSGLAPSKLKFFSKKFNGSICAYRVFYLPIFICVTDKKRSCTYVVGWQSRIFF